jgi:calcium-dependent protein kinase
MKNADKSSSGHINYSEFVTASISKRKFFSEDRLTMAFKLFDSDNKGYIGVEELKKIFSSGVFQKIDEGIWGSLIDTVVGSAPEGEEGRIDFDTFKTMMKKFTENEHIT